ncbi:MAG: 30S ribosomal protein S3 [Candidatus Komeilibacteria bacterium]|nr:30S ribosomal protein S3 [Candidatus Komeilibacteria bacterium]
MGHKVNPKAFRMAVIKTWSSKWYAKGNYAKYLEDDVKVRRIVRRKLREAGIDLIEMARSEHEITIDITAAKPGLIIGRGGAGIEELKKELQDKCFAKNVSIKINIKEVSNPNLSAPVLVEAIRADLEKRMPFRRIAKQSIDKVMKAGAKGAKICVAGRLNGAEIARTEVFSEGKVPLHTLRADIDYSRGHAQTTFGTIGIKVWIYKGEVFNKESNNSEEKK